jgi:HEAT repeat protein
MPVLADLRRALRDPDPLVRAEAARSLGRIGASECLNSLADCLLDPDMTVRIASSNAMRAIVTRDAAKELQD